MLWDARIPNLLDPGQKVHPVRLKVADCLRTVWPHAGQVDPNTGRFGQPSSEPHLEAATVE
jgi:hypothetical protein